MARRVTVILTAMFAATWVAGCKSTASQRSPTDPHGLVWFENFEQAQAEAARTGHVMLLNFTGSDWCGWCIRLHDEVFSQAAFVDYARANLLLVKLDFPRNRSLSAETKQQNDALAKRFGVRAFPTILLLSPEGKVLGRTGYKRGGAAKYVAHLKPFIDRYQPPAKPTSAPAKKTQDNGKKR